MSENGNGSAKGGGVVSTRILIPAGAVLAALALIGPQLVELGVRWGEMNAELRDLRGDFESNKAEVSDDLKLLDIRLRKLEPGAGSIQVNPAVNKEIDYVHTVREGDYQWRVHPGGGDGPRCTASLSGTRPGDYPGAGRATLSAGLP